MMPFRMPRSNHKAEFIPFVGGSDYVTPPALIPAGYVRESINVEEDINGGYATLQGYERYDGQASPSNASYAALPFTVAGTVAIGDTITGATSGATAVVIAITATQFIVTKQTGTFGTESTTAGGAAVSGPAAGGGFTPDQNAQYLNLAADEYRGDIGAVGAGTCSGSVLGVWTYNGVTYAFRNKTAGGVGMFKSTSLGWQAVSLGYEVSFTNANTNVTDGDTLTQGGVTATINRVVVETGTLASGVNTGRLIISAPSGGNFAAGAATSTGAGAATLSGAQSAITIPNQNGRYQFVNGNFFGRLSALRMYGCDGANRPFEFDGSVFVPLNPGSGILPAFITIHENHLFLGYLSSAITSGIGNPYTFSTTLGAAEIAFGDNITGFMPQPGSETTAALAVYCRNKTHMVYGTSSANWEKRIYNENAGAISYTVQKVAQTFVFDDRGVTSLSATLQFGNFVEATVTRRVKNWLAGKRNITTDSHVSRDKQQYRLFFSDGTAAYLKVTSDGVSMMPMSFPHPVKCSVSMEAYGGGDEVTFFGSADGYVYQMDKGTSFDGDPIEWSMVLVFNNSKMYRVLKKYRRLTFEMVGDGYAVFQSTYSLSYGSEETSQPNVTANDVSLGASYWDEFVWDEFVWDGTPLKPLSMAIDGDGQNISIQLSSNSDLYSRLIFSGVFLEYSPLRYLR